MGHARSWGRRRWAGWHRKLPGAGSHSFKKTPVLGCRPL
ncbi:putative protein without homology [Propionibacterium freudenreichii subsp. shermanii]|nr:putative protein without homology [Propionibacterium freudenreichii subsp. shermanii]